MTDARRASIMLEHIFVMLYNIIKNFISRLWGKVTSCNCTGQPRLPIRGTPDHHGISSRAAHNFLSITSTRHISIGNQWDPDRVANSANCIPVRLAFIELTTRTPMDSHHGDTGIFRTPCQFRRIDTFSSHPSRILSVTGTLTALTVASTRVIA